MEFLQFNTTRETQKVEERRKSLKKTEQVRGKFEQILTESLTEADIPLTKSSNFSSTDYEKLMSELKLRCNNLQQQNGDQSSIISMLTLAPDSWSIPQTASYFNVSESEVRRARILKTEKGVLSIPDKKKGRPITDEEKQIVIEFYESDDNSRMQPGMNDTVSVRITEGQKKVKLVRLLLMNIDELYSKYKEYCT